MNNDISYKKNYNATLIETVEFKNIEEKVYSLIIRDLRRIGWVTNTIKNKIEIIPPNYYDKNIIKEAMSYKRSEALIKNKKWIDNHFYLVKENLALGKDLLLSNIEPVIQVCKTRDDYNLFRILRYYWSSPYSEYVGRRIKLIIRDNAISSRPVIGIAALGSPIIHIPDRDNWVEWDKNTRTNNLIYCMDAYVIGALPPYNELLGGKLISYILASNEVRELYFKKYENKITNINQRTANDLVCIFTTSLYGKSSQYNRIKYNNKLLYEPIGKTKGFGTLHLSEETFIAMMELLKSKNININYDFGNGPSWKMRVIRTVGDMLGFDSSILLNHSFKRNIYAIPLAENYKEFLNNNNINPIYYNYPLNEMIEYWKERWLKQRIIFLKNSGRLNEVLEWDSKNFKIY